MDNNKVKAIKSTANFNVPFSGVMYSRVVDLMIYVTLVSKEDLDKDLKRIMANDPSLNPEEHAYHLQTLMVFLKVIEKSATSQNVIEEMTEEELQKQRQERNAPNL